MERCDVCHKTYDECKCAEYAENERQRNHELTLREKYCNLGESVSTKLKYVLIVAIVCGAVGAVIASVAGAISNIG